MNTTLLEQKNQSLYKRLWELEEKNEKLKSFIAKLKAWNPSTIINDLVNVQPMSQPSSAIYYLKYRYGTTSDQWTT